MSEMQRLLQKTGDDCCLAQRSELTTDRNRKQYDRSECVSV